MRRINLTLSGKTDSTGSALVRVPLERTGEWRDVKVALGTTGPAEWALVSGGASINFGRGRRPVLGPELLSPDEDLQVIVTGGPPNAILGPGACIGKAGTMEEIISAHVAVPNTIALDVTGSQPIIGTEAVPANGVAGPTNFPVPAGTQSIGFMAYLTVGAVSRQVPSLIKIVGHQTGMPYFNIIGANSGSGQIALSQSGPQYVPFDPSDLSVDVTLNGDPTLPGQVDLLASPLAVAALMSQVFQSRDIIVANDPASPAPWQRRAFDWQVDGAFSGSGTPSIGQAAGGRILIVGYWRATMLLITSATSTPQVQLVDNGAGGAVKDRGWMAGAAGASTPDKDKLNGDIGPGGIQLAGSAGLQWDRTIGANTFATLDMGGWFAT